MNSDKENEATRYAKAKVQQIRSKIYNPIVNKAKLITMGHQWNQQPMPRKQSREEINPRKQNKPKQSQVDSRQYYNRIKSINSINEKIRSVLGEKNVIEKSIPKKNLQKRVQIEQKIEKKVNIINQSHKRNAERKSFERPVSLFKPSFENECVQESIVTNVGNENYLQGCKIGWKEQAKREKQQKEDFETGYTKSQTSMTKMDEIAYERISHEKNTAETTPEKEETNHLAEILGKQIEMDQELRQHRFNFLELKQENKWELLLEEMKKIQSTMTLENLKNQININSEEHNPFLQYKEISTTDCIQNLVNSYCKATLYWQQKLTQCVQIKKLERQGFNVQDMDLNKKGYLSIEDLVCFINLNSGSFFRNRDTVTLFKRFINKGQNMIKYESFLQKVTHS